MSVARATKIQISTLPTVRKGVAKLPPPTPDTGKSREKAGAMLGGPGDILGISSHTDADSGTQKTKRAGAVKP